MLEELLTQLWRNIHSNEHVSFGPDRSDALSDSEVILIKNSFFLWCGLTAERASAVLSESNFSIFKGRLLSWSSFVLESERGFSSFLVLLDEVDDIVSSTISSFSSEFKAQDLHKELHRLLFSWSESTWRTLSPIYSSLLSEELSVDMVRFLRMQSNLLSKIHLDRSDLLDDSFKDYKYLEFLSFAESSVQKSRDSHYWELILEMRAILSGVVSSFNMERPLPKHGPGAVSIPKVKTKVDKYINLGLDLRIDYMLRKSCGLRMENFSPFPLSEQDRTSRVIFVPKTWKKLRGISAEPAGLQFFQQAVLRGIIDAIDSTPLRHVINLRDQQRSRSMALKGSCDGSLASIDLSSASDSVTLQLVKDVFGNSDLCRWLLATRSTHTLLGQEKLEIYKFAPMGSACCFPVECLIFAAASLASATIRHRKPRKNFRDFRVYGDDIICPSVYAEGVMEDLISLGFSVNSDKSYWEGDYRESCGMDGWKGHDVTPLKIKDFSFDFSGSKPCSYEHHSRISSYLNSLYHRGYKHVRSFLLERFLRCSISAKGQRIKVQKSLLFGDGSAGTISSCQPDNFHLDMIPYKGYQRPGLQLFVWKPRARKISVERRNLSDEVNYFEWLMLSRVKSTDSPCSYDWDFFFSALSKGSKVEDPDTQMILTLGVHDPWTPGSQSASRVKNLLV